MANMPKYAKHAEVVTASAFHLLVLLAPAPNFAGGFSVCCAARLLLLLPLEAQKRMRVEEGEDQHDVVPRCP